MFVISLSTNEYLNKLLKVRPPTILLTKRGTNELKKITGVENIAALIPTSQDFSN